jgi:hypothetical protein
VIGRAEPSPLAPSSGKNWQLSLIFIKTLNITIEHNIFSYKSAIKTCFKENDK